MSHPVRIYTCIEPLEARIAPAVVITNPLPDIQVGPGKTGATIDLSKLTAPVAADAYHTKVKFTTNVDMDPNTPGVQAGEIVIELFDQDAPRTVQDFLSYVTNPNPGSDYDNTIIHRSANLGDSAGNDIIQGGGYAFPGFGHIPVGPEVFNEYSAAHPNVRGTIALAKTGVGPSTGTSEWYINVADNSNTLGDTNNGGYTVFGQVVSGLNVVDKIAALSKYNGGGTFSDLPVQNGFTSGVPTADQVVRIVDAAVVPDTPVATSLTYTVSHIFQVDANGMETTKTSPVLTAKVTGSQLALNYAKGKSGVADVVVSVSDGTDTKQDTFRVDLRGNLFLIDNGQQVIVPGDSTPLTFKVINDGAATIGGAAKVSFQLKRTDNGQSTVIDLPSQTARVSVASGAAQSLTLKVPIPQTLAASVGETYQVLATIQPFAAERTGADNTSSGGSHALMNEFGTVDGRANVILKYQSGGSLVTWKMKGGGTGQLVPDGAGHLTLETSSTSLASSVSATSSKASVHPLLSGIQFDDAIGAASLAGVNTNGPVFASGGIKSLTLGDLTGPSLMLIGAVLPANATPTTLKFGNVTDFSLESAMPIASLAVTSWFDKSDVQMTVAPDSITAPSLGTLKTPGEFGADITLTDDAPVRSIAIGGLLYRATIKTPGNIGAVTVGGIYYSNIFAGVDARPATAADFTDARTIQSFTIAGLPDGRSNLFTNSLLAAQTLGTIKLKGVVPGGTGALGDLGLVADVIKSYSRVGGPTRTNVTLPEVFDDLGNFKVKVL